MSRKHALTCCLTIIGLLGALVASTTAQTFYLDQPPQERSIAGIRALKPMFDDSVDDQFTFLTSTYDLYFSYYAGKNVSFRFELPYTHVGLDEGTSSDAGSDGIGNIMIGVQKWTAPADRARLVYSLGVRLPSSSDERIGAASLGYLCDLYHIGRAVPKSLTFDGGIAYHRLPLERRDYLFDVEAGPTFLVPTEGGDPELLIHYGGAVGTRIEHLLLSAELTGLFLVTQDVDFSDRFDHQFAFGLTLIDYPVRPQLFYEIPLDSGVRDVLNGAIGFRVEYGFSKPASDWD